jgi:hypothetical protein
VTQRDVLLVAFAALKHEAHVLPRCKVKPAVLDRADPDLWALQVLQDANWAADLLLQRADGRVDLRMILLQAVAEVQAEGVDSREEQGAQLVGRRARGAYGGDDLGTAVTGHVRSTFSGRLC